jgi:Tfp pilus assembly protein PilZ
MLIDTIPRSQEKRLCLLIRNEPFRMVLAGILKEWRYSLLEAPTPSDLLLAEDGFDLPEAFGSVLWLTRSRYGERGRLPLPLSLEELWSTLESRFHKPPRSHIRINLQTPAAVLARGEMADVQIISLSDLGARVDFCRELALGEELTLHLSIAGQPLTLPGRVIYVVPCGDLEESEKTQVGLIFDRLSQAIRDSLREHIIRTYLERVRNEMTGSIFREGLSHFNVPPAVLAELGFR